MRFPIALLVSSSLVVAAPSRVPAQGVARSAKAVKGLSAPLLIGPEGARFWTTLENAQAILECKPIPVTTTDFGGRLGRGETHNGDRVVVVEEGGTKGQAVVVASADPAGYSTVPGEQFRVLFYRVPADGAPWIGKGEPAGNYHLKTAGGGFLQIGVEDDRYREVGGERRIMTRGLGARDRLTAAVGSRVFSLSDEQIVEVGEVAYRWVKPVSSPAPPVPILMSRTSGNGAKWAGEYGGRIYVER